MAEKRVIYTDRVMRPIAHFSHAARVGNLIHLGATAGTDAQRRLAGKSPGLADMAAQTEQMFANARTVLELLGTKVESTARIKTYIADLRDLPIYNEIYEREFGGIRPNHVIVGSAGFPLPQAAIELDLIAYADCEAARLREAGDAISAEGRFYCAGAPAAPGEAVPLGFDQQCQAAFKHLEACLSAGQTGRGDVVYLHATLPDSRDISRFAEAFASRFPEPAPACAIVAAPLAEPRWRLQLEAIAVPAGGRAIEGPPLPPGLLVGSAAMLAGEDLFIGGQLGVASGGAFAAGIEAQTRTAWERVKAILRAAGMGVETILRTNNVLVDWRDYSGFNAGYGANVAEPYPPRATVLGGLMHPAALVQVEAVAHRGGGGATIVQVR